MTTTALVIFRRSLTRIWSWIWRNKFRIE